MARILLISWCIENNHFELIVIAPLFGRTVMAWGCSLLPYAGSHGGTAASYVSSRFSAALFLVTIIGAGCFLLLPGATYLGTVLLVSLTPVQLFFLFCMKKIDGITGDCLGAANEIAELSIFSAGSIMFSSISLWGGSGG